MAFVIFCVEANRGDPLAEGFEARHRD